jgi:hypothetical protein
LAEEDREAEALAAIFKRACQADILKRFKSVTFDFKNSVMILEDRENRALAGKRHSASSGGFGVSDGAVR